MKVDFNIELKDLSGKPILESNENGVKSPVETHKLIAGSLLSPNVKVGDSVKRFLLAQKIYQNGEVEIDEADLKLVKDALKTPGTLTAIAEAQILMALDKVK